MSNPSESLQILNQAKRFENSAALLFANLLQDVNSHFIPATILAALSIELHFKAISLFENGKYPKSHNILEIYKKLDTENQQELKEKLTEKIINHNIQNSKQKEELEKVAGIAIPQDFEIILEDLSSLFIDFRYIFEKKEPKSFYYIELVRIVLEEYCQKIK